MPPRLALIHMTRAGPTRRRDLIEHISGHGLIGQAILAARLAAHDLLADKVLIKARIGDALHRLILAT